MKFFIDSANIAEIEELIDSNMVDGITTNPTLIAKEGGSLEVIISNIASLISGPVSAEVTTNDYDGMIAEGIDLSKIAKNVVVKLPVTWDGIRACKYLRSKNIMVNMTLCFSTAQSLIAAKAGASFISPFIGRLDDVSSNGMQLIRDIKLIYGNYSLPTEILVASIRNHQQITDAAKIGADIVTIPPFLLRSLISHPLTDIGLAKFMQDASRV